MRLSDNKKLVHTVPIYTVQLGIVTNSTMTGGPNTYLYIYSSILYNVTLFFHRLMTVRSVSAQLLICGSIIATKCDLHFVFLVPN